MEPVPVRVGVLGCGNVGAALLILINEQHAEVARRTGLALEVGAVAVRNPERDRNVPVDPGLFTDDPASVVANPEIDLVVEVMGGIDPAHRLVVELSSVANRWSLPTKNCWPPTAPSSMP